MIFNYIIGACILVAVFTGCFGLSTNSNKHFHHTNKHHAEKNFNESQRKSFSRIKF